MVYHNSEKRYACKRHFKSINRKREETAQHCLVTFPKILFLMTEILSNLPNFVPRRETIDKLIIVN